MKLPLSAIEVILGNISEEANISEDEVFDFILKWGRSFYPELEERRQIFTNRLIGFISFPHMRCSKLKEVLSCQDFEHEKVSKLVLEALFSKEELPWLRQMHVSKDLAIPQDCEHSGRVHSPHCVITLDLEKVALKSLAPSDAINSQTFSLGGNELYLCAKRCVEQQQEHLGLFIHKGPAGTTEPCTLDYDFEVLNKLSKEHQNKAKGKDRTLDGKTGWGSTNLLGITWAELINDNHDYFINNKLHLRAHVILKNSKIEHGDNSTEMVIRRVNEGNFGFAFNDIDFSDLLLHIEIIPCDSFNGGDKLRAEKYKKWLSCIHTRTAADDSKEDSESLSRVIETLHISSLILAANSPFFYKLFKNGMKKSQNKNDVSLKIYACEKATLFDLLNFMYGNAVSATSAPDLVDLLIAAEKFEVTSCMRHCVEMLLKFPMSLESALFYLELPCSMLENEIVKPLIDAAKQYFVDRHRDFTKSHKEAMELPVSAIEAILGSKSLQVVSEDEVFDFILKWGRSFYPELEERRQIFTNRLIGFISFPHMRCSKLKEVLSCQDFEHEKVSKLVLEALFSKVDLPWLRQIHVSKDLAIPQDFGHTGRDHSPHCVVSFDVKKVELLSLSPSDAIDSQTFSLGGNQLYLSARRRVEEQQQHLGLYLHKKKAGAETCTLDYDFEVMNKSSTEFQNKFKNKDRTLDGKNGWGIHNLLGMTWGELMNDNHDYFINDILHLRAHITLKNSMA